MKPIKVGQIKRILRGLVESHPDTSVAMVLANFENTISDFSDRDDMTMEDLLSNLVEEAMEFKKCEKE